MTGGSKFLDNITKSYRILLLRNDNLDLYLLIKLIIDWQGSQYVLKSYQPRLVAGQDDLQYKGKVGIQKKNL